MFYQRRHKNKCKLNSLQYYHQKYNNNSPTRQQVFYSMFKEIWFFPPKKDLKDRLQVHFSRVFYVFGNVLVIQNKSKSAEYRWT